jgi:STAS-like domain of unknown function (DUF4325)
VNEGQIEATGQTRRKRYALKVTKLETAFLLLAENRHEDQVWRTSVEPHLADLPENVMRICQYSFTEMFNNAIEHSEGEHAFIKIERTARHVSLTLNDDGIGIFEKIKSNFGLFDRYANPDADDYGFSRTHVPLRLAQYGQDQLMSRSQARRVLARFERFKEVFLDFYGIESIGQAFADEIFRVYAADHPEIRLVADNANEQVTHMIGRAIAAAKLSEP